MDIEQRDYLISILPQTEHGMAERAWIQEEIDMLEKKELSGSKICDDPLIEDFRTQLGMKIAFKRVMRKPQEILDNQKGG